MARLWHRVQRAQRLAAMAEKRVARKAKGQREVNHLKIADALCLRVSIYAILA